MILARYYALQITEYETYRTQSDRNRVQLQPLPPKRGLIYDRNGVLLADNRPAIFCRSCASGLAIWMPPSRNCRPCCRSPQATWKISEEAATPSPYEAVPLRFRLTEEERARLAVNRYRLPGVVVDAQLLRHYPHGELFSHALGYVGRINEREALNWMRLITAAPSMWARSGWKSTTRTYCTARWATRMWRAMPMGVCCACWSAMRRSRADLTLHLDIRVQRAAVEALGDRRGAVVAIDPLTGGVLALVSTPGFDTNLFVNGISSKDYSALRDSLDVPLFNRAIQGQYPPGSTVKPMMGMAGLESGLVTPETTVPDPGWYRLPGDSPQVPRLDSAHPRHRSCAQGGPEDGYCRVL